MCTHTHAHTHKEPSGQNRVNRTHSLESDLFDFDVVIAIGIFDLGVYVTEQSIHHSPNAMDLYQRDGIVGPTQVTLLIFITGFLLVPGPG